MEGKNKVIAILLVVVILVAIGVTLKRFRRGGSSRTPGKTLATEVTKVDQKTLEAFTMKLGEWEAGADSITGRYKNPKTGEFTMVNAMKCGSCGEYIPRRLKGTKGYKCPKCLKSPFDTE